ncbi:carboxypeptidase-like regulatory domain-containing protein [Ferruginibacter paludis]|uniref:carboxypeptidase-like regulatory domain-containing protein n=1 Tax=Ferruginibacter paludis TaxID=1310417 RepID=UPI0025B5F2BE|nr:carboxypeptidase-like regulatory domain-containing protein [Ferruginibacter paludis]MDN3658994.1 carboxypeptidase-like regulatory domain-containing protein [Ferruginibacter paludis]
MKIVFSFIAVAAFLLVTHSHTFAQNKGTVIYGKVISFEESFPIEGVSVAVKGASNATVTQIDGTFSLTVLPPDKILVISGNEYQSAEVTIAANKTAYEIVLQRKSNSQASVKNSLLPSTKFQITTVADSR